MVVWAILGFVIIVLALQDAFESIILPGSVKRRFKLISIFYFFSWSMVKPFILAVRNRARRQWILAAYPPVTVIALIAMWATLILVGFAMIQFGLQIPFNHTQEPRFIDTLYFSGVTLFTLGYGDMIPATDLGRGLAVIEAASGFGFLALVISYIPVLYGAFSRREHQIVLLDTKAGSDPTAFEMLRRYAAAGVLPDLTDLLRDWERFSAELLESYLSYPVLAYYRSQHEHQSWLRSLTAILDVCAFIEASVVADEPWSRSLRFQARNTFAMARHVLVDLAYILDKAPIDGPCRLGSVPYAEIHDNLRNLGVPLRETIVCDLRLQALMQMYEPFARSLATEIIVQLPDWVPPEGMVDNWQTSAWEGVRHF
ncbi:MAG: potassium channel family protein [Fimbriimonas sp.]